MRHQTTRTIGLVAQYANSTITWTGGKITGTDRVAFSFTVDALPAEGTLVFKALQTYDNAEVVRWVEPPLADGSEPAHPAPELTLTAGNTSVTTTRDSRAHHAHRTSLHICGFFVGQSEDLGIKERLCSIIAHAAPERGQFGGAGSVGYSATSLRELACEISR